MGDCGVGEGVFGEDSGVDLVHLMFRALGTFLPIEATYHHLSFSISLGIGDFSGFQLLEACSWSRSCGKREHNVTLWRCSCWHRLYFVKSIIVEVL